MLKSLSSFIAVAFFLSPYGILMSHAEGGVPALGLWAPVLAVSLMQAFLSACGSCLLGLIGALGFLSLRSRRLRQTAEALALTPNVVPSLFVILSVLNLGGRGLRGLLGVIVVHVLLNTGVVAVFAARLLENKVSGWADLAWIEGASRFKFLLNVGPALKREASFLFLFVFALCFSSFSVPLVMGGSGSATLEIFIYERVRRGGALSEALFLSSLQMAIIFVLSLMLPQSSVPLDSRSKPSPLLAYPPGLILISALTAFSFAGLFQGVGEGVRQWLSEPQWFERVSFALAGSFLISMGVAALTYALLAFTAWLLPRQALSRFLTGWGAPGAVLTGFAFLLLPGGEGVVYIKIILALTLLIFPALSRAGWLGALFSFKPQLEVAGTLGASEFLTFKRVVWPQLRFQAALLAGLAGLWASGEFAVSHVLTGAQMTLPVMAHQLMASYRLEMATVLVWVVAGCGSVVFALWWSCGYVSDTKP